MVIIVMGVSGCGKTTIGRLLAERLSLPFYDADDFHPPENVAKMNAVHPLDDNDRKIGEWNRSDGAVLACSALKQSYRDILTDHGRADVLFAHLKGSKSLILSRMEKRDGHYMPPALLDSQFDDLEEPVDTLTFSIEHSPEDIVTKITEQLAQIRQ